MSYGARSYILFLPFIIAIAAGIADVRASVFDESSKYACEGSINLFFEDVDEPLKLEKDLFALGKYDLKNSNNPTYVTTGLREGNCCYQLRFRKNKYKRITVDGHHEVKKHVRYIEMIDCVQKADIVVPVVATSLALVLVVTVVLLYRKRMQHRREMALPTDDFTT